MAPKKKSEVKVKTGGTTDQAPPADPTPPSPPADSGDDPVSLTFKAIRKLIEFLTWMLKILPWLIQLINRVQTQIGESYRIAPKRTIVSLLVILLVILPVILLAILVGAAYWFPEPCNQLFGYAISTWKRPDPEEIRKRLSDADEQLNTGEPSQVIIDTYGGLHKQANGLRGDDRSLCVGWALVGEADCKRRMANGPCPEARSLYEQAMRDLGAIQALDDLPDAKPLLGRLYYGLASLDYADFNDLGRARKTAKDRSLEFYGTALEFFKGQEKDEGRVHIARAAFYLSDDRPKLALLELAEIIDCANQNVTGKVQFRALQESDQVEYLLNCARGIKHTVESSDRRGLGEATGLFREAVGLARSVAKHRVPPLRVELANSLFEIGSSACQDADADTTDLLPFTEPREEINRVLAKSRWLADCDKKWDAAIDEAQAALRTAAESQIGGIKECQLLKLGLVYHHLSRANSVESPTRRRDLDDAGDLLCELAMYRSNDAFDAWMQKQLPHPLSVHKKLCGEFSVEQRPCSNGNRL